MNKKGKKIMTTVGILSVLLLAVVFIIFSGSRPLDKTTAMIEINELVGSQVGKQTRDPGHRL
jgi:hypothetical protein